jgi:hypothetical protein
MPKTESYISCRLRFEKRIWGAYASRPAAAGRRRARSPSEPVKRVQCGLLWRNPRRGVQRDRIHQGFGNTQHFGSLTDLNEQATAF